jgi:hypothetical protein
LPAAARAGAAEDAKKTKSEEQSQLSTLPFKMRDLPSYLSMYSSPNIRFFKERG